MVLVFTALEKMIGHSRRIQIIDCLPLELVLVEDVEVLEGAVSESVISLTERANSMLECSNHLIVIQ